MGMSAFSSQFASIRHQKPNLLSSKTPLRVMCLYVIATLSLSVPLHAETASIISDTQATQFIGQNVTVEGPVTAVSTSRKGNTFINFGGAYPHQTFTGWIPAGTPLAN